MTLQLRKGSTALPLPKYDNPYDSEYLGFGVQFRTADATYRTQHIGHKWRLRIYWHGLSSAERQTLLNAFAAWLTQEDTLTLPDGQAVLMQAALGSWTERVWYQPGSNLPYYEVSFQVEQV